MPETQTGVKVGVIIQLNRGSWVVIRPEPDVTIRSGRMYRTAHSDPFFLANVDVKPPNADGTVTIYVPYTVELHDDVLTV